MNKSNHQLVTFFLGFVLSSSAGCSSFTPADSLRGSSGGVVDVDPWPIRDIDVLSSYIRATPREIFEIERVAGVDDSNWSVRERFLAREPHYRVLHNDVHGNALLRMWEDRREFTDPVKFDRDSTQDLDVLGFIPNASLITSRGLLNERSVRSATLRSQALDFENSIGPLDGRHSTRSGALITSRLMDGAAVRIPPSRECGTRGLIFHFHSLHGNPGERAVLKRLVADGWTIVHFQTDARLNTPIASDARAEVDSLYAQMDELHRAIDGSNEDRSRFARWKELASRAAKRSAGAFVATSTNDAPELGRTVARLTDDAIASSAYGAEAVYLYLREHRPELLRGPLVLSGFSAGSLVTPAVAVRLMELKNPPKIDAVVLVGSGADLFALGRDSALTDGGITIRMGTSKPEREFFDAVHRSYLEHVRLDSVVTATALHGLDVLQVHASRDGWVPAPCGELLYEKLGRPDKLTVYTGHVGLFFRLGWYDEFISSWIDSHVDQPTL